MQTIRHRQRHVHATIFRHLRLALDENGWITPPVNWGQPPVTLLDYEPQQAGETPAYNTVAVSIGHQDEDVPEELGGGIYSCRYTVFIDVYPTKEAIGVAIADDIKFSISQEIIPLRVFDTTADGVEVDAQIEFEDVVVEVIPSAATTLDKRSWRAVKATAVCFF